MIEQNPGVAESLIDTAVPFKEGRVKERNFDILTTHIDGVLLLVDHGEEPDLRRSETRNLAQTGRVYALRAETIKYLLSLQKDPHGQLVNMGINFPGLRGVRDVNAGIEVQITPKTENVFDEELLDVSLGERRQEFVHKETTITVKLNPDEYDVEGFIKSLTRRLKRQGMTGEEINQRLDVQKDLRVDEKALQKLIKAGEIVLIPGAWGVKTKRWDIVPRKNSNLTRSGRSRRKSQKSSSAFWKLKKLFCHDFAIYES